MTEFAPRYEFKYLVDIHMLNMFKKQAQALFLPDEYTHKTGGYYIRSIYFDSPLYHYYAQKREGLSERLKPRLRSYHRTVDGPASNLFFEFKGRHGRTVTKRRSAITPALATTLLTERLNKDLGTSNAVLNQLTYLASRDALLPAINVAYKRSAFRCRFGRPLRITYDTALQCSLSTRLDTPESAFRHILSPNKAIIELKFNHTVPSALQHVIQHLGLCEFSLSKYALALEHCFAGPRRWWEHSTE